MTLATPKAAIVTGAGRGIGRACAMMLAGRGWKVALLARTAAEVEKVQAEIGSASQFIVGDVTREDVVRQAVEQVKQLWGRLDAVINAAGVAPMKPITQTSVDDFRQTLEVNLVGPFALSKHAWPELARTGGAIVNLSTQASRDPFPGFMAYASSKSGLNMLTTCLHREGSPVGIRAYGVAPGSVDTQMRRSLAVPVTEPLLDPREVSEMVLACIEGPLMHTSGETHFVRKDRA
jgi:NAD(P)-dependent dehydrogenase (short-subunit alcohol dehydrogenase family)